MADLLGFTRCTTLMMAILSTGTAAWPSLAHLDPGQRAQLVQHDAAS